LDVAHDSHLNRLVTVIDDASRYSGQRQADGAGDALAVSGLEVSMVVSDIP
jgi:hypothetical protein